MDLDGQAGCELAWRDQSIQRRLPLIELNYPKSWPWSWIGMLIFTTIKSKRTKNFVYLMGRVLSITVSTIITRELTSLNRSFCRNVESICSFLQEKESCTCLPNVEVT